MNQLFIGALDLSAYLTLADLDNLTRWQITCWNVPEEKCKGLFCNPINVAPFFLRSQNYDNSRRVDYAGLPSNIVYASFLDLELAPYAEINCMFNTISGRFGFHIKIRLYVELVEQML